MHRTDYKRAKQALHWIHNEKSNWGQPHITWKDKIWRDIKPTYRTLHWLCMSVVCLGWWTMTCTGWLFLSQCSTSLLWQSIVVFSTQLQGISLTTVCQSLKLLVASTCDLPDVINCQFREFATAHLGPVHFLPDQETGIHCLIICRIQLLTPNNLGETCRHIYSLDVQSVSALEVLCNRTLQINIYLLTNYAERQ